MFACKDMYASVCASANACVCICMHSYSQIYVIEKKGDIVR